MPAPVSQNDLWAHARRERARVLKFWRKEPWHIGIPFLVLYNKIAASHHWIIPLMKSTNFMSAIFDPRPMRRELQKKIAAINAAQTKARELALLTLIKK